MSNQKLIISRCEQLIISMAESYEAKAQRLYRQKVAAEFEYLGHLRQHDYSRFLYETAGFVWAPAFLPYLHDCTSCQGEAPSKELSTLYRKLALLCHPDKCTEPWAAAMFVKVSAAYERRSLEALQCLLQHWEAGQFEVFNDDDNCSGSVFGESPTTEANVAQRAELIEKTKREVWYQWYHSDRATREFLRTQYLAPEALEAKNQKLREENKALEAQIEALKRQVRTRVIEDP